MSTNKSPAAFGFRMPAEWEPHRATWLHWPHNRESWPGKFAPIPQIFAQLTGALISGEIVNINLNDDTMEAEARATLKECGVSSTRVQFHRFFTNDAWVRDCGPIFVKNKSSVAVTDWVFNKWGGKYPPWDEDNKIPRAVAELLGYERFEGGMVLEGGSIEVNGCGSLLSTEQCLLNKNRNPQLKKAEIEQQLRDFLGVKNILWLGEGIVGDDTDGHIDDLARFVGPRTVVAVVEQDSQDENYALLQDNLKRLSKMQDEQGRPLEILQLPMPRPIIYEGQRLPASYANFYIGNETVVIPTFADPQDSVALSLLTQCFPGRKVVGLDALDLIWGLGAFHCITQQEPL